MDLARSTWPELGTSVEVVVVPIGSCEQHGPHLPFVTDAAIATAVAERTVAEVRAAGVHAVLAPTLPYGASGEHEHFPGTVDIGHDALYGVLVELGRSISRWSERLVLVNGHGGNAQTVVNAVRRLRHEGRDAAWIPCEIVWGDAHAGRTETSLMSAIAPAAVRAERAEPGVTRPVEEVLHTLRRRGVRAVSPNGVLGDPTGASAAEGAQLLAGLVDAAVEAVLDGEPDSAGRLRAPVPA